MKKVLSSLCVASVLMVGLPAFASPSGAGGILDRLAPEGDRIAQTSCPAGTQPCPAGDYGPGGCYRPGYATCTAGLVCTGGLVACKPSNGAPAYCYRPGYGSCN